MHYLTKLLSPKMFPQGSITVLALFNLYIEPEPVNLHLTCEPVSNLIKDLRPFYHQFVDNTQLYLKVSFPADISRQASTLDKIQS